MKQYNRIILGKGGLYADKCLEEKFIGADFDIREDLTYKLKDNWRIFNDEYVPIYMAANPEKTKVSAGLACGFLWTICKGLKIGDIVLCPNGRGSYMVGEITGDYYYASGEVLPHRRNVKWSKLINRNDMSDNLRHSTGSIGTCCDIAKYQEEIERLIHDASDINKTSVTPSLPRVVTYHERELHKIFCSYLRNSRSIYAKTIFHEKSTSKDKEQKWVHPDIIGVSFKDYSNDNTLSLLNAIDIKSSVYLYSFELKREIKNDYNLKEYYFQALSNSSWANFGYLVAYEIDESLKEEMERLNNAFGIGIIRLQAKDDSTQILYPAREHELDYTTINKLCSINPDFNNFINKVTKVMKSPTEYKSGSLLELNKVCDDIFCDDKQVEAYCIEHNIPF